EREAEVCRIVEAGLFEPGLDALGEVVRDIRGEGDRAERYCLVRYPPHLELTVGVVDVLGRRLEQVGGDPLALFFDLVEVHLDGGATDGRRAAPVRPHAEGNRVGVAVDDLDLLHGNAEVVGDQLGERGLVTLAVRVRSRVDRHHAGRVDTNLARLVKPGSR